MTAEKRDKKAKKHHRQPTPEIQPPAEDSGEEGEEDIPHASGSSAAPASSVADSDVDDEGDPSQLVHESLAPGGKHKHSGHKTKYVPEGETSEQRDARTVFVGNVPLEVMKSKVRLPFVHCL